MVFGLQINIPQSPIHWRPQKLYAVLYRLVLHLLYGVSNPKHIFIYATILHAASAVSVVKGNARERHRATHTVKIFRIGAIITFLFTMWNSVLYSGVEHTSYKIPLAYRHPPLFPFFFFCCTFDTSSLFVVGPSIRSICDDITRDKGVYLNILNFFLLQKGGVNLYKIAWWWFIYGKIYVISATSKCMLCSMFG